jgi:hypothetical protein
MKNFKITYLLTVLVCFIFLAACKKEGENIFNMFRDVDVTYHNNSQYSVTDHKEVNVDDSVYIDFTITSKNKGMHQICVWEAGSATPFLRLNPNDSQRFSYSNVVKLKMSSKTGLVSYRVWALDSAGVYIGDGYKTVSVFVKPDYNYWSNRYMSVPDTLTKAAKCYISLRTGSLYSYEEAKLNPDLIDAAIFYDEAANVLTNPADTVGGFVIYSLDAAPTPFPPYDISSWAKRSVVFSSLKTNQANTFRNTIRTGSLLKSNAGTSFPNKKLLLTSLSGRTPVTANNMVYFKTPEGKVGALFVNYITGHSSIKGVIFNVDVKIMN